MIDTVITNRIARYVWRATMFLSLAALIIWGVCTVVPLLHPIFHPPCPSQYPCSRANHPFPIGAITPMFTTPLIIALSNRKKNGQTCMCTSQQKLALLVVIMLVVGVFAVFVGSILS